MTYSENQLTGSNVMRLFTKLCLRAGFHFSLNVNVDIVVSYMNSNSREIKRYIFL